LGADRKLLLIKHALPELVPTLPAAEWHLSRRGRVLSELLAKRIAAYSLDVIVSSIEPKAMETAEIIAKRLNKQHHVGVGLHEHDRRNIPLMSHEQLEVKVAKFYANPDELVLGNETGNEAYTRFANAITRLIEQYPQKNIGIVAHGTVISLFVARAAGVEPFVFWKQLGLPSFVVFSLSTLMLEEVVDYVQ
jgi:broad specificity phosphatase PhoE